MFKRIPGKPSDDSLLLEDVFGPQEADGKEGRTWAIAVRTDSFS